jgi:hypothetical protein
MSDETSKPDAPVLVVAYDDKARAAMAASMAPFGVAALPCATFQEAEDLAREGCFRGILVDLATMIKAKDVEKIIAHTLTGIYPTLRIRCMGGMLIPMIMAGDAQQDKSVSDFATKTCAGFAPRRLRLHKRKEICLPVLIGDERLITLNLSWTGAFLIDMHPERFAPGQELTVRFLTTPNQDFAVGATVVRVQSWGMRRHPGIGLEFKPVGPEIEKELFALLRSDKESERDRLAN